MSFHIPYQTFFSQTIPGGARQQHPRAVVFTSEWCPDCTRNVPHVIEALRGHHDVVLVDVGSIAEWKDPLHPARTGTGHPEIRISSIPSLIIMSGDYSSVSSIVDLEHAKTLNQVQNLIMAKTEGIMVNSSH
mmetsp:Transcript_6657/g.13217  ORF Transcript_6657/g.13217 Transcript_6657/m.13217 type:complete len:132 (+) Transcript_6657:2151-2546(+)|eukprot:jgi/Picre1/34902/NNA_002368.t1